jgi:hypothetical protein
VRLSTSKGVPYYFNTDTKQSSWEPPPELTQEEVHQLPGAAEYLGAQAGGGGKPSQIRASHLLVKHAGSRRPSSWKEVRNRFDLATISVLTDHGHFRQASLAQRKTQSSSSGDTKPKLMAPRKSLENSQPSIQTVHLTRRKATLAGSGQGRCKRRLRTERTR